MIVPGHPLRNFSVFWDGRDISWDSIRNPASMQARFMTGASDRIILNEEDGES